MLDFLTGPLLAIGQSAPNFQLPDQTGRIVNLKSFRGKPVVLIFYPGDDTTVCTQQLCEIRDEWRSFQAGKIQVLGINGQGSASHEKFAHKYRFPFPLLVDQGWTTCRAYNTGWGIVRRTVYIVDPSGNIGYAKRGKPAAAEIVAAAAGLRTS